MKRISYIVTDNVPGFKQDDTQHVTRPLSTPAVLNTQNRDVTTYRKSKNSLVSKYLDIDLTAGSIPGSVLDTNIVTDSENEKEEDIGSRASFGASGKDGLVPEYDRNTEKAGTQRYDLVFVSELRKDELSKHSEPPEATIPDQSDITINSKKIRDSSERIPSATARNTKWGDSLTTVESNDSEGVHIVRHRTHQALKATESTEQKLAFEPLKTDRDYGLLLQPRMSTGGLKQLLKLTFFAAIPAIIAICQNIANLVEDIQVLKSTTELKENVETSVEIARVVHHLQIERGLTALFVESGGERAVKQKLETQYQHSGDSIFAVSKWTPTDGVEALRSRENLYEYLWKFRTTFDPENITLKYVIDFYTNINTALRMSIAESIRFEMPFAHWIDLTAFELLLSGKDQVGIERAIGSTYYARGQLPRSDLFWYLKKQTTGVQFLSQAEQYSSYMASMMDKLYQQTHLADRIASMRMEISSNLPITQSVSAGTIWFGNMTEYINILEIIQDGLAARIVQHANDESNNLKNKLIASALQLAVVVFMMPVIVYLLKTIAAITRALGQRTVELEKEKWQTECLVVRLEDEKRRMNDLLCELLPKSVATELIETGDFNPEAFSLVTIMFADVVDFTRISSSLTPADVVGVLNRVYVTLDACIENYDVYKMEITGFGYMVASGIPKRNGFRHVAEIANLSLDLLETLCNLTIPQLPEQNLQLRIGFHTGPCTAGVVGNKMPRYCIFGDTVNIASMVESTSLPLRIQMSESSAMILKWKDQFHVTERGIIDVKGKGMMRTFWLDGPYRH